MQRHEATRAGDSTVEEKPQEYRCGVSELSPPELSDPVLELYKRDIDRTLLIKNLSLTPAERAQKLVDFVTFLEQLRQAGHQLHRD